MAEQKIEFRKVRDFGENLNDTFLFIRQNLKPLLAPFFAICGIFMIAQAIFNGIYQNDSFGIFDDMLRGRQVTERSFDQIINLNYILMIASTILTFAAMQVTLGAYIKYYVENNGAQPGIEDVWRIVKRYFFRVLFYNIPLLILTVIGFVFCIAPGVWVLVVWVPFTYVVMIEEKNFSEAFNRCFDLVKEHFWTSLAIYLVAYIVYYFCTGIIGLLVGAVIGVITYLSTENVGTTAALVTSFLNIFSFIFYIIYFVSVGLHYFNLAERRDGTGLLSRIESIGASHHGDNHREEEY